MCVTQNENGCLEGESKNLRRRALGSFLGTTCVLCLPIDVGHLVYVSKPI